MIYRISNSFLSVSVDSFGAELQRIVGKDGTEYMCRETVRNWNGHAPVLFPNTGAVKDGYAILAGRQYPYVQHGFAKDSEFQLMENKSDRLRFRLQWSEASLRRFPYRFVLEIEYRLYGNVLEVSSMIQNLDDKDMYCNLGFHPGFSCPILSEEQASDYQLIFPERMTADRVLLQDALVAGAQEKFWEDLDWLPVTEGMFDGGSFTMVNLSSKSVKLRSKISGRAISLHLGDYPNLVLWAPKYERITNICIEPWYGIPDLADSDHKPESKPHTLCIGPESSEELCFRIQLC